MKFTFVIPDSLPEMTVKVFLEEQLLIPRKIRHFLRIKKHILINQEEVHWHQTVKSGDECQLIFDEEDYPTKEIIWGNPNLVQEVYQDQHLIIVNKPEGMKTHGNQPEEIAHIRPNIKRNLTGSLIRVHIGFEDVDELIADLKAGFERIA